MQVNILDDGIIGYQQSTLHRPTLSSALVKIKALSRTSKRKSLHHAGIFSFQRLIVHIAVAFPIKGTWHAMGSP